MMSTLIRRTLATKSELAVPWQSLPDVVVVRVMVYLENADRVSAAKTFPAWSVAFYHPTLWRRLNVTLGPKDPLQAVDVECFERYGRYCQALVLTVDSTEKAHSDATTLLKTLAKSSTGNLQRIHLKSSSTIPQPIDYIGLEWINIDDFCLPIPDTYSSFDGIEALLSRPRSLHHGPSRLLELVCEWDEKPLEIAARTLCLLASKHKALETLKISFSYIPDGDSRWLVTSNLTRVLRLLDNCRQLTVLDLSLTPPVLCSELLQVLGSAERRPLRYMSIALYGFELSYHLTMLSGSFTDLTCDTWHALATRLPDLEIGMSVEASYTSLRELLCECGLDRVDNLNVTSLDLVMAVADNFELDAIELITGTFARTLTTCNWKFGNVNRFSDIETALMTFSSRCPHLTQFHLHGVALSPETIAAILDHHPLMKTRNTYSLQPNL